MGKEKRKAGYVGWRSYASRMVEAVKQRVISRKIDKKKERRVKKWPWWLCHMLYRFMVSANDVTKATDFLITGWD